MPKILIIEDDVSFAQMLQGFLSKKLFLVEVSHSALSAKSRFKNFDFDIVLTDLRLPNYNGIDLLCEIKGIAPHIPIIIMTGFADVSTAVNAMKKGASDYISKPFTTDQIIKVIENALKQKKSVNSSSSSKKVTSKLPQNFRKNKEVSGNSQASKKLEDYIKLVAPTDISVLITGESGTGKEVTATAIHNSSNRKEFNFIAVDCGAIPRELAASEFFGHVKGSFTGAVDNKIGNFEAANGGTLFLDEVGNLSYGNQQQLLRVLQERKIKRIGSVKEVNVNVRIIAATNENLKVAVEEGRFREDLFHRLNEFSMQLPTLKDRIEDLTLYAEYFLQKANLKLNKVVQGFSNEVWIIFNEYSWPGNIRELQNVINRAVLLTPGEIVEMEAISIKLSQPKETQTININFSKAEFEKEHILKALKKTNFNKSKAAKLLQITRKTLYNRINHYKLDL